MLEHLLATPFLYSFGRQGVLVFVIMPTIIAAGLYFSGQKFNLAFLKYIGFAVLAAGIALGVYSIIKLQDPLYASYYDLTQRSEMLHYAILVMPVLGTIGFIVLEIIFRRNVDSRL